MKRRTSFLGIDEPPLGPAAAIVIGAALLVWLALTPFVTHVGQGEIVVEECGRALTVWRGSREPGFHWDGLCATVAYPQELVMPFSEPIEVDEARVKLRGKVLVRLPADDDGVRELHRKTGSVEALTREIAPMAMSEVLSAAADPGWHRTKGNPIERLGKDALEYALRRVSPTGAIWSSHEARHALEADIRRRLQARSFPYGLKADIELGFVTER